ncbi:hypothetical protein YDYSY3_40820 [Paenibacillus chitinolyticus]|nr:hypothetical protein YDYSY3_40820 [Paenibacillus chitinolyticus]
MGNAEIYQQHVKKIGNHCAHSDQPCVKKAEADPLFQLGGIDGAYGRG